ncbi:alpha/beta hydrolase [Oceanobacillus alkalisoli]|uniref:alpha/beta hydrolase n=1 Tax=Oceanobacillus alkalisoli TaxID=2925113 RepID=UPI001EF02DF6|nr:alpha/beta hydrolase [Oceanobacillus alkalisoli]MCF3942250.1 lysophospholipase [Oceanobacillus alkalisoli]MCG5104486.1 lysophospholipase [Oceanobacillus alkalisoli]
MNDGFWLIAEDDCELYVQCWGKEMSDTKAVMLISHGMTEHIRRYNQLAAYFNTQGFIVYGDDHRGHGKTGEKQGQLGFIAETNGFDSLVQDLYLLVNHVKKKHPALPVFIYGHSMGSFITRNFIQKYSDEITGVILSGTGFFPERSSKLGLEIASLQAPKKESTFMNNLVFGHYNNKIAQRLTSFDWLSRDEQVVKDYIADPLSGYVPTAGFFVDLLTGILLMQDAKRNKEIRKDLPMLFVSGDADPVGNYSKGVFRAAESYTELGLDNVLVSLFPEARHELHQETNKEEVFDFLERWMMKQL